MKSSGLYYFCFLYVLQDEIIPLIDLSSWLLRSIRFLLQDSISLPVLQFMPAGARIRCWLLSLHDLQLLPRNETCGPQMQGERSWNQLSNMLWFFIHIKWNCQGSALWAFYAFSMLSGSVHFSLLSYFHVFVVRKDYVCY